MELDRQYEVLITNRNTSSFPRKRESICVASATHIINIGSSGNVVTHALAIARRWIPAFAGMTARFVQKLYAVGCRSMNRYVILSAIFVTIITSPSLAAPKEKDLGAFGVWHSYAYDEGGQTVCYMVTAKTTKGSGKNKDRNSYLMITHRPVEASTDVFSYGAGAQLESKRGVALKIGNDVFDLFSIRDTAWARDARIDHKLAAEIRTSATAQTSGFSSGKRISAIKDQFSLTGALPAYRAINKACGLPDPEGKKPAAKKPTDKKPSDKKRPVRKKTGSPR